MIFIKGGTLKIENYSPAEGIKCSNSLDFHLFYLASYHLLMKQKEYDQWNDPQKFYSDDYILPIKGMAILHEY